MFNIESVKKSIEEIHSGDRSQLDIIFNNDKRIIVEAPAGCGKTKTMISKIAYILATQQIEKSKKILALTFSVNASYKIKKDVFEQLPIMLECTESESLSLSSKIMVSNYHGFCRRLLSLYGYLVVKERTNFTKLVAIDDSRMQSENSYGISQEHAEFLSNMSEQIKNNNSKYIEQNWIEYNKIVIEKLIPKGIITYNAIILLAFELLKNFSNVKFFYQRYFPIIFIDEFQDTNYIAWLLIKELISEENKIVFMGDSLQRIYGFIGAVPNLMKQAESELEMQSKKLNINYRFKYNKEMLLLDNNIRLNAEKLGSEKIVENANPDIIVAENQYDEAKWICKKVDELSKEDNVAILVRTGASNKNTKVIQETLEKNNISYFFALFTDEDTDYIKFHETCIKEFSYIIETRKVITSKVLKTFMGRVSTHYKEQNQVQSSLLKLLEIFCDKILTDYKYFSQEEKIQFMYDTFENKGLRQNMDKIEEKVVLATIHACKGLEYPYVIIADNEQNSFPTYKGCCEDCYIGNRNNTTRCKKIFKSANEDNFFEELSVFYVGFTRARKKVFFTMSKIRISYSGKEVQTNASCFLKLKGIGYANLEKYVDVG